MPSLAFAEAPVSTKEMKKLKKNSLIEAIDAGDSILMDGSVSEKKSKKIKESKKRKALDDDEERSETSSELGEPVNSTMKDAKEEKKKKKKKAKVDEEGDDIEEKVEDPNAISKFRISQPLREKLKEKGIESLFPIQAMTFDIALDGYDLVGRARTGQGKTLAFVLPILESLINGNAKSSIKTGYGRAPSVIVLLPTRELAKQVHSDFEVYGGALGLTSCCLYGGAPYSPQEMILKKGVDIVVGTPGRVKDHIERNNIDLRSLKFRVLDEADEMLRMGFVDDVELILGKVEVVNKVQTLLFSATLPSWVKDIASRFLKSDKKTADLIGNEKMIYGGISSAATAAPKVGLGSVHDAVQSLLKWRNSKTLSQKPQLLDQEDFVYLILTLKKIPPKARTNPYKIPLPNPLHSDISELCLFIDDRPRSNLTKDASKKKIQSENIHVSKIIKFSKLKINYRAFEEKRKLCDSYDAFFVDKRLIPLLPRLLGKHFFKKKKIPVPLDLQHKNWKEQIRNTCHSALLYLKTGTCSVLRVAKTSMESEEIEENVIAAINGIAEIIPKKWDNVRSIHLKLLESVALPIYQTVPDMKLKIEGVIQKKEVENSNDEKDVEGVEGGKGNKDKKVSKKRGRIHEVRYMDNDANEEADQIEEGQDNDMGSVVLKSKKTKKGIKVKKHFQRI